MTTVINNPDNGERKATSAGAGVVIGAVLVILVLVIVILYSLPYIRAQMDAMKPDGSNIKIEVPLPSGVTTGGSNY